jgi:hypothetical protein
LISSVASGSVLATGFKQWFMIVFYSYNCIKYYNIYLLSVWADCDDMLFYLVQL